MTPYILALALNCFMWYHLGKKHGFEEGYRYRDEEIKAEMKNPN